MFLDKNAFLFTFDMDCWCRDEENMGIDNSVNVSFVSKGNFTECRDSEGGN